jgi:hypothetical protein
MKLKSIKIFAVSLMVSITASAQYSDITVGKIDTNLKVIQIDNYQESTVAVFEYEVPTKNELNKVGQTLSCSDGTFIKVNNSAKQYHLLSSFNLPISTEAENKSMSFDYEGQKHCFALEFERIPDKARSFDVIDAENKSSAFNIENISFTDADSTDYYNIEELVDTYPIKEVGSFYVNGGQVFYAKANDIITYVNISKLDQYGKYIQVNLSIQNYSNKSILFDPYKIDVQGYNLGKIKQKSSSDKKTYNDDIYYDDTFAEKTKYIYDLTKSKPVELQMLSFEQYDKVVKKKQQWNSFWNELGESLSATQAGNSYIHSNYSSKSNTNASVYGNATAYGSNGYANASFNGYGSSYTSSYGQSDTYIYNGAAAYAARQNAANNISNYNAYQREIRQQLGDGYVRKHTIPTDSEYSGYFNIKWKDIQMLIIRIRINNQNYPFTIIL